MEEAMFRLAALAVITAMMSIAPVAGQASGEWQRYVDPTLGFSAALPLGAFAVVAEDDTPGLTLKEIGGHATINLYGGPAQGMTREALESRLESGAQRTTTTYKAGGESWFVLSGYYDGMEREDTIFYTKVMFSPDHQTFSAFEITFPAQEKQRFEPLVEHFEDNFTRPRP
jgi:hypothetical protein